MASQIPKITKLVHRSVCKHLGRSDTSGAWKGQVAWRIERDGWVKPLRVFVTEHGRGLIRFRGDRSAPPMRKVWPFSWPALAHFELTVAPSEVDHEFVGNLMKFVLAYTEGQGKIVDWPLFSHDQRFPGYAWSQEAEKMAV